MATQGQLPLGEIASALEHVSKIYEFGKRLKEIIDFFKGKEKKPDNLTKKECEAAISAVQPVLDNSKNNISIDTRNSNGNVYNNIQINYYEAADITKNAKKEIELLNQPSSDTHNNVIFYWEQTKRGKAAKKGASSDKGVIPIISKSPQKVYFSKDKDTELKHKMVEEIDHPYKKLFRVDVEVINLDETIKGYNIIALNDVLEQ